jgi:hypothetical protein
VAVQPGVILKGLLCPCAPCTAPVPYQDFLSHTQVSTAPTLPHFTSLPSWLLMVMFLCCVHPHLTLSDQCSSGFQFAFSLIHVFMPCLGLKHSQLQGDKAIVPLALYPPLGMVLPLICSSEAQILFQKGE